MEGPPEVTGGRAVRVGSVVIDCRSLEPMVAFWSRALGYSPNEAGRSEDWCRLDDPNHRVNVSLQVVPEPTPGKNKLHLDLYTPDQRGEVERLKRLGATVAREPEPEDDFVVMADPEGNLFCVIDKPEA
jgi:catechol 2,3-dioxygenase-like lactoylglutathione lyase family enzyme